MTTRNPENLSDAELEQLARKCHESGLTAIGSEAGTGYLLQAQIYRNELDRRHDSRISIRDFILEMVVILMIGAEIWMGYRQETNQQRDFAGQQKVLNAMQSSMTTTATQLTQTVSSLQEVNTDLQNSLTRTKEMAGALQQQLKILRDEQAARLAEAAKAPKIRFYVDGTLVTTVGTEHLEARQLTATQAVFDVVLMNVGTATATNGSVRAIVASKDVNLTSNTTLLPTYNGEPNSPTHVYLIPFERLRPQTSLAFSITAAYPAGQAPFLILFNYDADQVAAGTDLGAVTVTPPAK
jgi:hypothetical protein